MPPEEMTSGGSVPFPPIQIRDGQDFSFSYTINIPDSNAEEQRRQREILRMMNEYQMMSVSVPSFSRGVRLGAGSPVKSSAEKMEKKGEALVDPDNAGAMWDVIKDYESQTKSKVSKKNAVAPGAFRSF